MITELPKFLSLVDGSIIKKRTIFDHDSLDRTYMLVDLDKETKTFHIKTGAFNGPPPSTWLDFKKRAVMTSYEVESIIKRIPGAFWSESHKSYSVPANELTLAYLAHSFTPDKFSASPRARKKIEMILSSSETNFFCRQDIDDYNKDNMQIPELPPEYDDGGVPLLPYQKVALSTLLKRKGGALFMEQGTGKTPVAIRYIMTRGRQHKKETGKTYTVLVVVPKSIRENWFNEVIHFGEKAEGRVDICDGPHFTRVAKIIAATAEKPEDDFSILIAGYDSVSSSMDAFQFIKWDLVILDESHLIKSSNTRRTKSMLELRNVANESIIMTGTPIGNHLLDIYPQLEFIGEGESGFPTKSSFASFYSTFDSGTKSLTDKLDEVPILKERISGRAFVITKKKALPFLPEKVYDVISVEMTPDQHKKYCSMRDAFIVEINNMMDNATGHNRQVVAQNALVKMLRLAQITSGFISSRDVVPDDAGIVMGKLLSDDSKVEVSAKNLETTIIPFDKNPKLDTLVEEVENYLNDFPESKVLIWGTFIYDVNTIHTALTSRNIRSAKLHGATSDTQRSNAVWEFNNDDKLRVIVGHPAVGGVGLNLLGHNGGNGKMNCDRVFYYSSNWSLFNRKQSEDRCHRMGTRNCVRYTDVLAITPNGGKTIDHIIVDAIKSKKDLLNNVMDIEATIKAVLLQE